MNSDKRIQNLLASERGASMVEYAMAAGLLAAIFVIIGIMLYGAAITRGRESGRTAETMGACSMGVAETDPTCL